MKLKKIIVIGLAVLLVMGIGLHYLGATIFKAAIESGGTAALETEVEVETTSLWAMSGTAEIDGLTIHNLEGFEQPNLLTAKSIRVEVSPLSLLSSPVTIGTIVIEEPVFALEAALTTTNLTKLLAQLGRKSKPAAEKSDAEATDLEIEVVRIENPKVILAQSAIGSNDETIEIDTIEIQDWETTTISGLTFRILGEVLKAIAKKNRIPAEFVALLKRDIANIEALGGLGVVLDEIGTVGAGVKGTLENGKKILNGLIPGGN